MTVSTPTIGQVLGHYRIVEMVGSGGMGVVFRAHDEQLHRDVAVKILPQLALLAEPIRRQFRHEALSLARITDPNVAMAFDFGRDHGVDYLVTEYVPGLTLDAKIAGRSLSEGEVLNLGKQLASGLESAHRHGVIHRDLKPGNLRITPEGRLKILDFGLAFLLQAEAEAAAALTATLPLNDSYDNAGTLPYMSPEQVKGNKPDVRADIWSAGAVLYEMSTGKSPFGNLTGRLLVAAILDQTPPAPRTLNPKISDGLERVILRALKKDPAERYQSAGDLRIDLNNLATGTMPVHAKTETQRRRWLRWCAAAAIAIILVVAGFWGIHRPTKTAAAEEEMMAVLPFESVAKDASTTALGLGLSETVTAKLVQASDNGRLQLVSTRDLVAQGVKTAEQARREFGTDLVLEGSLQQSGEQIRITCSLVNSRTHMQLAARTVTGAVSDIFALQDELVEQVAAMLPREIGKEKRVVLESRPDTNPAAYDLYLRGRGYLEEYENLDNIEHAIAEFERAVEVDPNYAPAHAAMGMAYTIGFQQKNQGKDWLEKAQAECGRALAITTQLAEGHTCMGNVYFSQGRYEDAVQQFQRSLDLDHNSDEALRHLAETNQKLGNVSAAEDAYRKAIELRPDYWGVYNALGGFYSGQARYEEAARMFRKVTQLAPSNYRGYSNLGGIALYQGQYREAVDALKNSIALRPTFAAYGNLGTAYFYLRRYEDAADSLQEALRIDDKDWLNWGNLGDTLYQMPSRRVEATNSYRKACDLAATRLEVNPRDTTTLAFAADYYAMLDQERKARGYLARALALAPSDGEVLFRAAILYNHFDDKERTLSFLRRAVEAGYSRTVIRDTPDFDHLKNDPQFPSLPPKP
jgi:eukaryotic-like serine/threonine-protein kinase